MPKRGCAQKCMRFQGLHASVGHAVVLRELLGQARGLSARLAQRRTLWRVFGVRRASLEAVTCVSTHFCSLGVSR